jgi:hypothetical protein
MLGDLEHQKLFEESIEIKHKLGVRGRSKLTNIIA